MAKSETGQRAGDLVADSLGRLMEFWGFKRTMGRIWGTLFLSNRALSAAELCERLGISAGAASMTLSDLERWGVIHRLFRAGERREFFEAETNLWKMISRVYEERERHEIDRLIDALENALKSFSSEEGQTQTSEETQQCQFSAERVRRLLHLAQMGRTLLSTLLESGKADMEPIKEAEL